MSVGDGQEYVSGWSYCSGPAPDLRTYNMTFHFDFNTTTPRIWVERFNDDARTSLISEKPDDVAAQEGNASLWIDSNHLWLAFGNKHADSGSRPGNFKIHNISIVAENDYVPNSAPEIQGDMNITPSTFANVQEDIQCEFHPYDDDGIDTITAYVDWYKNSNIEVQNEMIVTSDVISSFILESANTSNGEEWSCAVRLNDGLETSDWSNTTTTLITPTLQDQEVITPYNVHYNNDVDCNFTALGNESSLTAYVQWYQDGIYQSDRDDNKAVTNASISTFTLSTVYSFEGNTWICEVRVNNGVDYSSWINSSDIEITNDRVWYGNVTVTQDSIVQGMTYLEATFSDLVDSVLHWILKTELKETDLVGGILAKKVSGTPMLFLGVGNQTIGDFAVLGAEGKNTYMQLTPSDKTEIACNSAHVGAIIYSSSDSKHYGCDGSAWNALY